MQYQVVKVHRTSNQYTGRRYLCATLYKAVRLEDGHYVWKDTGVDSRNRIKLRLVQQDAIKMARKHGVTVVNEGNYWQGLNNKTAQLPDSMVLEDMLKELEA